MSRKAIESVPLTRAARPESSSVLRTLFFSVCRSLLQRMRRLALFRLGYRLRLTIHEATRFGLILLKRAGDFARPWLNGDASF